MRKTQYVDLVEDIAGKIEGGAFPPGFRLPTHRRFAEEKGVAVATASRVYKELQERGLIVGERGRGVFVRDPGLSRMLGIEQTAPEGLIDLVCNIPREKSDPEILRKGLQYLISRGDLDALLQYQPHSGRPHERAIFADHLETRLGRFEPDRLLITSGIQHSLTVAVMGALKHGDLIGTDEQTYPGFKSISALRGCRLTAVAGNNGSMDIAALEALCRKSKPRALYLMPTVHNPIGSVMDEVVRHQLIECADRHDLLLIEDSAYSFLEPDAPPNLVSLAPHRTIHVGGFSKSFATGLRVGYIVCPTHLVERLGHVIRATTWNTPALNTALISHWIEDGTLSKVEEHRRADGARRQKICQEVLQGMDIVAHPNASVAWLPLPNGVRSEPIAKGLNDAGIAVSSGEPFNVSDTAQHALRLAFGGFQEGTLRSVFEEIRLHISRACS